jgi:hypothetical protein
MNHNEVQCKFFIFSSKAKFVTTLSIIHYWKNIKYVVASLMKVAGETS